jgi:hypothetical protein
LEKITRIILENMEVVNNVAGVNGKFADDKRKDLLKSAVGVAVSVAVIFATVWVAGRAWKTSQKA